MIYLVTLHRPVFILPNQPDKHKDIVNINAIEFIHTLPPSVKRQSNNDNLLQNKERHEKPTHKTAHLQTTRAYTKPKFAKELFSCRRTDKKYKFVKCLKKKYYTKPIWGNCL
jgi:hypothetical protein